MKTNNMILAVAATLFSLCSSLLAQGERPTIDALVGEEFLIEDTWAGQSITLTKVKKEGEKGGGKYVVVWKKFGSGRPIMKQLDCKVKVHNQYQFSFFLDAETKKNEFTVSITDQGTKVFLNGVRVQLVEDDEE